VADYHRELPGWSLDAPEIRRRSGPILQGIIVGGTVGKCYRIWGYVRVLVAPMDYAGLAFPQQLGSPKGAPDWTVDIRSHARLFPRIVAAMKSQLWPRVDQPLDVLGTALLLKRYALPTIPELYELAPLFAYLGERKEAIRYCEAYERAVRDERAAGSTVEWGDEERFVMKLKQALARGEAKEFLDEILAQQLRRWGLS
jgi:hypothetical protein